MVQKCVVPNTAAASPLPKFLPSSCAPVKSWPHLQGKRINVRAVTTIVNEPYGGSAWGARLKQAVACGVARFEFICGRES